MTDPNLRGLMVDDLTRGRRPLGNVAEYATDASGNTLLVGPDGAIPLNQSSDETWCLLGDSITANNNITSNSIAIGAMVRLNNVVTVTLSAHNFNTNQNIAIRESTNTSSFNGRFVVTRTGTTTFTFPQVGADETSAVAHTALKLDLFGTKSWFQRANMLGGGKWRLLNNGGAAGQTTAMMLARVQADVIDYAPTRCAVFGGINDVNTNYTAAAITANLDAIYSRLLASGINTIAVTILPHNSTHGSYYSIARNQVILAVNSWIRRRVASTPNMKLLDAYSLFVDKTSVNGYGTAAYYAASDAIHPGVNGAAVLGAALNTLIGTETSAVSPLVNSPADTAHAVTASAISNENRYSGGWAASGTTSTGTGCSCDGAQASTCRDPAWLIESGGGGSQTCVSKLVARSDGRGYDQQMTLTAAVTGDNFTARTNYNATPSGTLVSMDEFVPGGEYEIVFDYSLTGVSGQNLNYISAYIQMNSTYDVAGVSTAVNSIIPAALMLGAATDQTYTADITGVMRCRVTLTPFAALGVFQVYFYTQFSGAGTAVLRLGAGSIRKVS